jgi:hypothetical protein
MGSSRVGSNPTGVACLGARARRLFVSFVCFVCLFRLLAGTRSGGDWEAIGKALAGTARGGLMV